MDETSFMEAIPTNPEQEDIYQTLRSIGSGSLKLYRKLTPPARSWFLRQAEQVMGGDTATIEALYSVDYKRIPADPMTFLTHTDYMGHMRCWPAWVPLFEQVCRPFSGVRELMLTGAQGLGKTTFASGFVTSYKIHRLACMKDPARFYGLAPRTQITFGLYAMTKKQIQRVGFYVLKDQMIEGSPFFREVFPKSPHGKETILWEHGETRILVETGCLAEGTLIAAPGGDVPIESLAQTSERVTSFDGEGTYDAPYEGVAYSGIKPVFDLVLDDGRSVRATAEHKFAVVRKTTAVVDGAVQVEKVPLSELKEGDYVAVLPPVRRDETGELLRGAQDPLQGVREGRRQLAVPRDEGVATAGIATLRHGAVHAMRADQDDRRFWGEAWRAAEILVPAVRDRVSAGAAKGASREIPRGGCAEVEGLSEAGTNAGAVGCLLQEAPRADQGAALHHQSPFTPSRVAEQTGGEGERLGLLGGMAGSQQGDDPLQSEAETRHRPESTGTEEGPQSAATFTRASVREHAYSGSGSLDRGDLWGDVHLLLRTPEARLAFGSFDPPVAGRWEHREERSPKLSFVQLVQEREGVEAVHTREFSAPRERGPRVHWARVVSVSSAGEAPTYDVYNCPGKHLVFANGIGCSNSERIHAIGRGLFAVVADELNYYDRGVQTAKRARELVSELSKRLGSRFIQYGGDIPGVACFVSQTRTESDFLEQRIKKMGKRPGVLVVRGPRWKFNPLGYEHPHDPDNGLDGGFRDGDTTFRVFRGTETVDPVVLDVVLQRPDGGYAVTPDLNTEQDAYPAEHVIDVPVTHFQEFVDDIHDALRLTADVPSSAATPFFSRKEVVGASFRDDLPFPFATQTLGCYEGSTLQIRQGFNHKAVTGIFMGKHAPLRHPQAPRYIHLDLAFSKDRDADRAGIAMVHPSAHYFDDRDPEDDEAQVGEQVVIKDIEVDFYLALEGGPFGQAIDFLKVRIFIEWLRRIGFWIRKVSADSFQSFDMLQRLREQGFVTEVLSVDKNSKAYKVVRQVFSEGRFAIPYPRGYLPSQWGDVEEALKRVILFQEILGLEHHVQTDKVDHREKNPDGSKGSKDIIDGITGASFACIMDKVNPGDVPTATTPRAELTEKLTKYMPMVSKWLQQERA